MRDLKTLIALMLSVLGCSSVSAEIVTLSPYKMDFNIEISTVAHDFAVGSSWGHKVDYYMYDDGPGYVRYNYHADGGIGNSGCLEIGSQTKVDWDTYQDYELNDMLVTPELSGTVSLYVKMLPLLSSKKEVKFYTMTETDGKWVIGSEVVPTVMDINDTDFTKVELPAQPAGTRIGIRGYYVLIDDFEAESAEVEIKREFKLVSAVWAGGKYTDCDAENNYNVKYKVKVKNTGNVTLNPGDESYSILLKRRKGIKHVAQVAINQALAPGEISDDIELNATLKKTNLYPNAFLYVASELTGDTINLAEVNPSPYEADFRITGAYGYQPLPAGCRIEYGTSRSDVGVNFYLRNVGASSQKITEISTTPGFKTSVSGPLEIAGHDSVAITVSITPDVTGDKHGKLTIKGDNGVNMVLNLNGYTVADSELYYDFESGKVPEGFVTNGGWHASTMPNYIYSINNNYCLQNGSQDGITLVLPKMKVKEGDKLSFELSKIYKHTFVDLCYSADRHNWKVLRTFKAEEMSDSALAESLSGNYYAFTKFVVDEIPAGEWYIGFKSGNVFLDNIVTDYTLVPTDHDAYFDELFTPASGEVNNKMHVSATLHNIMNHVEEGEDYKAEFYLDDECVGVASSADIAAMGYRFIALDVTPHKAGVLNGYWKYSVDGVEVLSDTVKVEVAAEQLNQVRLTDELIHHKYSTSAPFDVFNWNGESEAIYTAEEINLPKGTKITSISWYGTNEIGEANVKGKVYLQNTDKDEIAAVDGVYSMTDRNEMTKTFDGKFTIAKAGNSYNCQCLMTVFFDEPFVYDGGNLRLATWFCSETAAHIFWASTKVGADQNRSISRNNIDEALLSTSKIFHEGLPVIGVGYQTEIYKVSGVVKNEYGMAVAGAKVTLTNDNILYSATTDELGCYSIDVCKTDRDYTMTVSATNYANAEKAVSFNGQDVTLDVVLDNTTTGIEKVKTTDNVVEAIFTVDGKRVSKLQKGLNIVRMSNGDVKKIIK